MEMVTVNTVEDVDFWEEEITEMIDSGLYGYCEDFLSDVLRSIEYSGVITKRQVEAVENIKSRG